jgi:hydrogen peroxide-dependent heme synthase
MVSDPAPAPSGSPSAPTPVGPSVGLGVLHLFCRVGDRFDPDGVRTAEESARKAGDQVVAVSMMGHKSDIGLMVLGPDLGRLGAFQRAVQAAGLDPTYSYVSLTEVSEYAPGLPEDMKRSRLYPELPPDGKRAFCFYPMSKRRSDGHNWYALDFEARKELMTGHGRLGRTFHGRVVQLITGSVGLDDWEWGVTLFATRPDDLKECVYQMRFDDASAHYAEFGPFLTGVVGDLDAVLAGYGAPGRPRVG